MQNVSETAVSLNLGCFLQTFKLHRGHCNKAGWFGVARKSAQRAEKSLASYLLFICSQPRRCTGRAMLIKRLGGGAQ